MKIAIISDIHANKFAFDKVMHDIIKHKCEHIFILGDLVGYYYWPQHIVSHLMKLTNCSIIRGNHEDLLYKASQDSSFREKCRAKYGSGLDIALETLSELELKWLQKLPQSHDVLLDGLQFGLFHGTNKRVDEYLYPDASLSQLNKLSPNKYDFIFLGHTHYPVAFYNNNTVIANPGAVGQPRDIGSLASYMILNTYNKSLSYKRVPFDSSEIIKKASKIDPENPYLINILKRNNIYA